ncbi:hypothetical protein BofuT4_uP154690.1 [Botrytis cinerea T4]|uniref:Uncharacterized protein n=1 Tax=Botryotinia fuckeliana (strain T4) TaxID=999810 RepID=G2YVK9_BOTF4|nr:hypothetical protein BofuT4_uP154690.1 [Botrytis cinerea T4]
MRDRHKQLIHPARLPTFLWLNSVACIPTHDDFHHHLQPCSPPYQQLFGFVCILQQEYFTKILSHQVGCDQAHASSS